MTAEDKRKGSGGKLARSETVTIRLDPRLRYLAGLAARKQRRTVSSFIEWAIEDALNRVCLLEDVDEFGAHSETSINSAAQNLWDVDEADRFAKLAFNYPDLLTHDEQILWKLVRENGYLWGGRYRGSDHKWSWEADEHSLNLQRLRKHWSNFVAVAKGEGEKSSLPTWAETKEVVGDPSGADGRVHYG